MSEDIKIIDFIKENKDYIFVYSTLIALESVLMIFKKSTDYVDEGIFQASLLCGITLLFLIWIKFIFGAINSLNVKKIKNFKNAILIAENAMFSILLGYPIFVLTYVIYKLDTVNFIVSVLIVLMVILLFGSMPFSKLLGEKISDINQEGFALAIALILLAIFGYFWLIFILTPIIVKDMSQINNVINKYLFFSLISGMIITILFGFIVNLYTNSKKS